MNIIIVLLITLGFAYYYRIIANKGTDRIEQFFLAGRNIGVSKALNCTWSTSLGFGTSMFVAIWGGYKWGLATIWLEATWALGMVFYAFLVPHIVYHTDKYTLHGYLGALFGERARYIAGSISLVGLLFGAGFELSFIGAFFATTMNMQGFVTTIVVLFALLLASYSSIGGYAGNAKVDILSNRAAGIAMVLLLACLVVNRPEGLTSIANGGVTYAWDNFLHPNISWAEMIGFMLITFYQLIDMTNWQTISASRFFDENEKKEHIAESEHVRRLQRAIMYTGFWFMVLPAIVGTFIGYYVAQIAGPELPQSEVITTAFRLGMPNNAVLTVLLSTLILFGFISSVLGACNSWLMASVQTISWDMLDHKLLKSVDFNVANLPPEKHRLVTQRAKIMLFIFGMAGSLLIYYLSRKWADIFQLQFVMFGAGLTMVPWLLYGCLYLKTSNQQKPLIRALAFVSLLIGLALTVSMYGYGYIYQNPDITGYIPLTILIISSLFTLVAVGLYRLSPTVDHNISV